MTMIPQLAPHLSEVARQKLLLPAFGRASKDPHPPCRLASLRSTTLCQEYFTLDELATKVLPGCMPLVLDGVGDVRSAAFEVIDEFLRKLKSAHKQRSVGEVSGTVSTVTSKMPVLPSVAALPSAAAVAPSSGSYLGGLSGWYSSTSAAAPTPPPPRPVVPPPQAQGAPVAKPAAPKFSSINIGGETLGTSGGWDDDDDDLGLDDNEEEDVFASIGMNSKKAMPASSGGKLIMKKAVLPSSKVKKADVKKLSLDDEFDGWDDF